MDVVTRTGPGTASPDEVEEVYAAASAGPPLAEPPDVAATFAGFYARIRHRADLVTAEARDADGVLVGFAYGHPWHWSEQDDPWSARMRERLGAPADILEGRLAVHLIAVHPRAARAGLGRRLLQELLATGAPTGGAWLQTIAGDTPAMSLYRSEGWTPVGNGPDGPDGRPGLVLLWGPPDEPR